MKRKNLDTRFSRIVGNTFVLIGERYFMNTLMKSLLVSALALSAAHVQAATNKTYLAPRPVGQNLAMEVVTFNELVDNKNDDRFGGNLQVTGFYSQSADKAETGKYFGVKNKNKFTAKTGLPATTTADLDASLIVHDTANATLTASTLTAASPAIDLPVTITLNPSQVVWGARFDYHQDLDKLVDGLYFRAKLPVVKIENDMELAASSTDAADAASVLSYFNGTYSSNSGVAGASTAGAYSASASNAQAALTHAKIAGKQSKTTVADFELVLGYAFLDKDCYRAALNLGLVIPTGNVADGVHAFEPVAGNGGHWAFGAGLEFGARVWGDEQRNIKFNAQLDYRYAFEAAEKRTLGLLNANNSNFGQYNTVVTTANVAASDAGAGAYNAQGKLTGTSHFAAGLTNGLVAIPVANVLTMNVNVTPGSSLDFIAGLAYNHGGFSIDLGYNLNWKEAESVARKDAWTDTKYSYINGGAPDATTGTALTSSTNFGATTGGQISLAALTSANTSGSSTPTMITNSGSATTPANIVLTSVFPALAASNISTAAAATPSAMTNKVYGQVGYIWKNMEFPVMLGAGGHYEFASSNAAIENWGVNIKAGISF